MQSRLLDMLTLRGEFDCRRRWRRFLTMETIFWLNKTCIRPKKDGIKCLVKGKNRLHRPKSSPGVLFLVVPSPAISAYRGTKGVSSLSTGPSIHFTLKNLRNVLPNRFRAALSWKLCNGYRFPVSF